MQRHAAALPHKYEMVDTFQLTPEALGTQRNSCEEIQS